MHIMPKCPHCQCHCIKVDNYAGRHLHYTKNERHQIDDILHTVQMLYQRSYLYMYMCIVQVRVHVLYIYMYMYKHVQDEHR